MARNRKNQSAAIRFGPAIKAFVLCLLVGGSGVGYVWQKSQIAELGEQIRKREKELEVLQDTNEKLSKQLALIQSPSFLEAKVQELNLGLVPAQPSHVWRLPEPVPPPASSAGPRQFAAQQNESYPLR